MSLGKMRLVVVAVAAGACGSGGPVVIAPTLPPVNAPPPPEAAVQPAAVAARPKVTSDPDVPSGAAAARDAELAKLLEPLLAAFRDDGGALSADGKRLVWSSDRDGVD